MKNYVFHGNIPPHLTKNTSIEFYEPKYKEDGTLVRNRFDNRVRDKQGTVQPFSVTVFEYKPKLLEHDDVETIYNAILSYIENGNYTDSFANTPKRAWEKTKTSQIKVVQKSSSDEKTNESTHINNTRKIYKLNRAHIKRIDEKLVAKMKDVLKSIDDAIYAQRENSLHRDADESFEQFNARMKNIYKNAVDSITIGMDINSVEKKMKKNKMKLAEYGSYSKSEDYNLYTVDGNRYSEGITVIVDGDFKVVDVFPPYSE